MSAFMLFKVLAVMNNKGKNLSFEQVNISESEQDFLFSAEGLPYQGQTNVKAEVVITCIDKVISKAQYVIQNEAKVLFNELVEEELKDGHHLKNVDSAFQTLLYKAK